MMTRTTPPRRPVSGVSLVCAALGLLAPLSAAAQTAADVSGQIDEYVGFGGEDPTAVLPTLPVEGAFGFSKTLLETPRAVSLISSEMIDKLSLSAVEDLVRVVPGVFTTTRFGIQGGIDVRNVPADTYFRGMRRVSLQGNARSVLAAMSGAVSVMSMAGIVFFVWGEELAMVFTGQRGEIAILTGQLLKVVALATPVLAVLMVLTGALRGAGDTRWMLAITFVGLVGVRLPLACLLAWPEVPLPLVGITLPGAGLGALGAWYAMVIDVATRASLASLRFQQGGWKGVQV